MTKKKILVLSDHPLSPSGVGTQTKYMIEALLKTGRYSFICLGGAMKHHDYTPQKVEPWNEDWMIFPVDGYGSQEQIRSVLQNERPDALWFMTDPRFYGWLWEIDNEIRANVPMMYYHVWDNFPPPHFNGRYYRATDEVVCISKVTHKILETVAPEVESRYLPHAVNNNIFKHIKDPEGIAATNGLRENIFSQTSPHLLSDDKKIFFWNNRNARRKQSGTLIWWFKEWLDKVGHDKATLLMHTDARDPHGQDLPHIIEHLGVNEGQVMISTNKVEISSSGGTNFGDDSTDQHIFTGSVAIVSGGLRNHYFKLTAAAHNIAAHDHIIVVSSSAAVVINLPSASVAGAVRLLVIKDECSSTRTGGNAINVSASAPNTIDHTTNYSITGDSAALTLYCDGISKWFIY